MTVGGKCGRKRGKKCVKRWLNRGEWHEQLVERHSVAELPCFGLKVSAMLVHQRSDTRTVYFHALYFVLNLDNHN